MSERLRVVSPWTGEEVFSQDLDDPGAIERKVALARSAAAQWCRTPLSERQSLLESFIEIALIERDVIGRMVSTQMGKPLQEGRGEVGGMVSRARMMIDLAPAALADTPIPMDDGIHRSILRQPLGVVLDIAAWNYPLLIVINVVAPISDREPVCTIVGFCPPSITYGQVESAVEDRFLAACARCFKRSSRIVQPDIDTLDQVSADVDVIIFKEHDAVLKVTVVARVGDFLNELFARLISRMRFSSEDQLNWAAGMRQQTAEAVKV